MSQAQHLAAKKRAKIQRNGVMLLAALKGILPHPIFGTTDLAKEREYWEYEKSQGRGEADAVLFAISAIEKAEC